jgi:hypothetical protein
MSVLVITKQTGNYFKLVVDSEAAIISEQNRLTTIGNFCNFKTVSGANLILKQNILFSNITIITNVTVVPTSVNDLWNKLIEAGFFDGLGGSGSGTATRFDALLDTFTYAGRGGQIIKVNDTQTGLESEAISVFSADDRTKLDGIQAEAEKNAQADWNEADPNSDSFIANKPANIGSFTGIYEQSFVSDGITNDFLLPTGAKVQVLYLDRGPKIKTRGEWSQLDTTLTITGALLAAGRKIDLIGAQS